MRGKYKLFTVKTVRQGRCQVCKVKTLRAKQFSDRDKPAIRNPDGSPRTEAQIYIALQNKAREWTPSPESFTHQACAKSVLTFI